MSETPPPIEPETKDWTFVITDGCARCGFRPFDAASTGQRLRAAIPRWRDRLAADDVRRRPAPTTWSPLEYGAHVRDVCGVMRGRLAMLLGDDDPELPDWDQDADAVLRDYAHQDPATIAEELTEQATVAADAFDAVDGAEWDRAGRRSDGARFTVATLGIYLVHDVEHHLHDVGSEPSA